MIPLGQIGEKEAFIETFTRFFIVKKLFVILFWLLEIIAQGKVASGESLIF
jgi:hypothetical protein